MAAIVPLPPIHLTQRAVEWLTKSKDVVPSRYVSNVGWAACWAPGTDYARDIRVTGSEFSDGYTHGPGSVNKNVIIACHYTGEQSVDPDTGKTLWGMSQTIEKPLSQDWCCGVSDVRAMYLTPAGTPLEEAYSVTLREESDRVWDWARKPVTFPTCPECRVKLDWALEHVIPKTGRYRDVDSDGNVRWAVLPAQLAKQPIHPGEKTVLRKLDQLHAQEGE